MASELGASRSCLYKGLNGGWTADPKREKTGRDLGFTRYDKMAEGLGCYGEYVEKPEDIGPALQRAQKQVDQGRVALVNVKTGDRARHHGGVLVSFDVSARATDKCLRDGRSAAADTG